MPIYEFQCQACSRQFETLVIKQNESVTCPQCGGDKLQKLISAHTVGSGAPDTACGTAPCAPRPPCGSGGCSPCS